jgi:hypothetical protein
LGSFFIFATARSTLIEVTSPHAKPHIKNPTSQSFNRVMRQTNIHDEVRKSIFPQTMEKKGRNFSRPGQLI